MNVRLVIVRVRFDVPRTRAAIGDTQPLHTYAVPPVAVAPNAAPFTAQRIAVLVGLAFLAGVVLPLHPAFCIGTLGVLVAVLWKISVCAVQP